MADPLTTNMQFAVPTRGSDVGTWDTPLNGDWNVADAAFGSVTSVSLSNANVTLTVTQAQAAVLRFSGTLTANISVTLPAIQKFWTVFNITTGSQTVQLTTGSGLVIALPPGNPVDVFSDGTNLYFKNLEQVGTYVDVGSASVPIWVLGCSVPPYLICDGSTFSAVTYPALAALLGTTTLPDLRGRTRFALNGGTGRISLAGSGIDGDTRFSGGGVDGVTLTSSQIPANIPNSASSNATFNTGNNTFVGTDSRGEVVNHGSETTVPLGNGNLAVFITTSVQINPSGGGVHTNMPPTQISGITMIRAA